MKSRVLKFLWCGLLGAFLVMAPAMHWPSQAKATNPSPCEAQWIKGQGYTSECFQREGVKGVVEITYLQPKNAPNPDGWAAFVQLHSVKADGKVGVIAWSPLTASRHGFFPTSSGVLRKYQSVGGIPGFPMQRAVNLRLSKGKAFNNPRAAVVLHGPYADDRNNPSTYSGGLDGYVPPTNPNTNYYGSLACFRVVRAFDFMAQQIQTIQKMGRVRWVIHHIAMITF